MDNTGEVTISDRTGHGLAFSLIGHSKTEIKYVARNYPHIDFKI